MDQWSPLPEDEQAILLKFVEEFCKPERKIQYKRLALTDTRTVVKFSIPPAAVPTLTRAGTWAVASPFDSILVGPNPSNFELPYNIRNFLKHAADVFEVRILYTYRWTGVLWSAVPETVTVILYYD